MWKCARWSSYPNVWLGIDRVVGVKVNHFRRTIHWSGVGLNLLTQCAIHKHTPFSLSLSHTHTHTLTYTHVHTHPLTLSLSLSFLRKLGACARQTPGVGQHACRNTICATILTSMGLRHSQWPCPSPVKARVLIYSCTGDVTCRVWKQMHLVQRTHKHRIMSWCFSHWAIGHLHPPSPSPTCTPRPLPDPSERQSRCSQESLVW